MRLDIVFDYQSLNIDLILSFIDRIEEKRINKIEVDFEQNLLRVNPLTNEKYQKEKRLTYLGKKQLILNIKEIFADYPNIYIYTESSEYIINGKTGFSIISSDNIDIDMIKNYFNLNNVLSISFFNYKDELLESMGLHLSSLKSDNNVNFYPGLFLYINKKLLPNDIDFFNHFKPEVINENMYKLTFSFSQSDITLKSKTDWLFNFLRKENYKKSKNYKKQVDFVNYLQSQKIIEYNNTEFEKSGNYRYKNEYNNKDMKIFYYLNLKGESVIKREAQYIFIEFYVKGKLKKTELNKVT